MAELLIKWVDATHEDPEKDRRGCYKRGDVVAVHDDGHEWGAKEGLPNFIVLRIPGAARALAERLTEEQDDDDDGNPLTAHLVAGLRAANRAEKAWQRGDVASATEAAAQAKEELGKLVYRRRRWRVDLDDLPVAARAALQSTGRTSITRAQIRSRLKRKRDGAQFNDL